MNTSTTQKRRPKGLTSVGVVLAAILVSLMIQGTAQAWWNGSCGFPSEAPDGKIWWCYPYDAYPVPGGVVWYCYCLDPDSRERTELGWYWFLYDYQSNKLKLLLAWRLVESRDNGKWNH